MSWVLGIVLDMDVKIRVWGNIYAKFVGLPVHTAPLRLM